MFTGLFKKKIRTVVKELVQEGFVNEIVRDLAKGFVENIIYHTEITVDPLSKQVTIKWKKEF
jgi:hypothetical protein